MNIEPPPSGEVVTNIDRKLSSSWFRWFNYLKELLSNISGTKSDTFQLNSLGYGAKLKGVSLAIQVRNSDDSDFISVIARHLTAYGMTGEAGGIFAYNPDKSYYCKLYFAGNTSNRIYKLPDDDGTELVTKQWICERFITEAELEESQIENYAALPTAQDNATAETAGVAVGGLYRTDADPFISVICVRTA